MILNKSLDYLHTESKVYCTCCENDLLDYILYSKVHKQPLYSYLEIIPLKDKDQYPLKWNYKYNEEIYYVNSEDLSDHYPVYGRF